jgi:hypothetical protein
MIAASASPNATRQPLCRRRPEDADLRDAALEVLRSSAYPALRRLRCDVAGSVVRLHGVLPSYYLKQMAQATLQRLDGIRNVINLVEVQGSGVIRAGDEGAHVAPSERVPTHSLS